MIRFAFLTALAAAVLHMAPARADEEKVPLDKLPAAVTQAVLKRFPKLEMKEASKEKDGDKLVYEVTLKKDGKTIDVTLTETGTITTIEEEIEFKDLPKAVAKTFEDKYPNAKYDVVESVTKVADGKETIEYYEATLLDAGKKKWEVEVLADGTFKAASAVQDESQK
jgi:hypothetical protein